ncbi:MAG: zinc-ribbon domain-containing protein [Pirellulales bacterium]|nr:zinc-ribbon domain-containing protein [Pirellulales bacterium]
MPIRINCQCGKVLNVRDDLAGKAVKCPHCATVLKVGGGGASAAASRPTPRPAQPRPAAPAPSGGLDDLFDEEGFSSHVAAVCPSCRAELSAGAVLCTKCGYNLQTGQQLAAHKTAGVDVDYGTLALEKAEKDLHADAKMQSDLVKKGGLPWWALALILILLSAFLGIGVVAVNASKRADNPLPFNPSMVMAMMTAIVCYLVAAGANILILVNAFQEHWSKGLFCLFIPFYMFYYVVTHWDETGSLFILAFVMNSIGGTLMFGATAALAG